MSSVSLTLDQLSSILVERDQLKRTVSALEAEVQMLMGTVAKYRRGISVTQKLHIVQCR